MTDGNDREAGFSDESRRVGTAHRNGRVMVGNAHPTIGIFE